MRWFPCQNLKQDCAEEINVSLIAGFGMSSICKLRRHVSRSSANGLVDAPLHSGVCDPESQAPICYEHFTKLPQHHVLRFDIPMHQSSGMRITDRVCHPQENIHIFLGAIAAYLLIPAGPVDSFHRIEEVPAGIDANLMQSDNIRMIQPPNHPGFCQKPITSNIVVSQFIAQNLDRNFAIKRPLMSLLHHPSPATPKSPNKPVIDFPRHLFCQLRE